MGERAKKDSFVMAFIEVFAPALVMLLSLMVIAASVLLMLFHSFWWVILFAISYFGGPGVAYPIAVGWAEERGRDEPHIGNTKHG